MKSLSVTIQMKATEQYFPVVLFIMLYKVVLTFEAEVISCSDYSKENSPELLSYGGVLFGFYVFKAKIEEDLLFCDSGLFLNLLISCYQKLMLILVIFNITYFVAHEKHGGVV